jgi:hypothetical protein
LYFVADSYSKGFTNTERRQGQAWQTWRKISTAHTAFKGIPKRILEPQEGWVVDGLSKNVGAVRGFGNAIHPKQAEAFIRAYMEITDNKDET